MGFDFVDDFADSIIPASVVVVGFFILVEFFG